MEVENDVRREASSDERAGVHYLRVAVYSLAALLALSLLVVGTVAIIAEVKGTWHWMIHLESTISYMALFISAILAVLVPLTGVLLIGRRWWNDA